VSERLPLLLTHGYGASSAMWAPNVGALARDRRVITWDLPGHGASRAAEPFSHAGAVQAMVELLDEAGAERAVVGGMSLGGYLSLAFHLAHPDRVAALVLVDTGPGYRNDEARDGWNAWANGLAADLERDGLGALPGGPEKDVEHVNGPAGLAAAARGILTQRDASVIDSLPRILVPSLIVVGEDDTPFLASADAMERRIPHARKVVIPEAGHAANMDQPALFNAAVLDFLEAL
jgi:pimeloyl-ACP methyl ester carboxylesterase